jgi:hypothetical protein
LRAIVGTVDERGCYGRRGAGFSSSFIDRQWPKGLNDRKEEKSAMKKTLFLAAAVVCAAFLLVACNNTTGNNSNAPSGNSNETSRSNNNNATKPADGKPADTVAGGTEIGVAECDAYLKHYEACVSDKVPENMRATFKSQVEQARASYKQAAATPQGKAALVASCKQAEDATKKALASYNCTW